MTNNRYDWIEYLEGALATAEGKLGMIDEVIKFPDIDPHERLEIITTILERESIGDESNTG